MVDRESHHVQRESNQTFPPGHDNCIRRSKNGRMGGSMPGHSNRGPMEQNRTRPSYQYPGTNSLQPSITNLSKKQEQHISSYADGQHHSNLVPLKNGGLKKQDCNGNSQGDMGISITQKYNSDSGVHSVSPKCRGRLPVTSRIRLKRVETLADHISENLSPMGISKNRFIRVQTDISSSPILQLETRSTSTCNGRFPTVMEGGPSSSFSPILSDRKNYPQTNQSQIRTDSHHSLVEYSTMVSTGYVSSYRTPNIDSLQENPLTQPSGRNPSINSKQKSKTSGMAVIRKRLQSKGVSEKAANLISSARSKGTRKNYESAWKKFSSWCYGKQINPIQCPITDILDFLSHLFESGLEYRTINNHRSAISAFHDPIEGIHTGKHKLVCTLMTGIANERPPQPRYNNIWDVQIVLNFIKTLPDYNNLSLRQLTLKTMGLLALAQINRGSEIKFLDTRFMRIVNQSYVFSFNQHTKTSRKNKKLAPDMIFNSFTEEEGIQPYKRQLCPFTAIQYYLQATKALRKPNKTQLFIGQIKPHNEVTKSTIAGWLKLLLKISGIDTTIFKAHSFRAACSSRAKRIGVPIEDILKTGNWTNCSVWQKFYHKPINNSSKVFQNNILKNT